MELEVRIGLQLEPDLKLKLTSKPTLHSQVLHFSLILMSMFFFCFFFPTWVFFFLLVSEKIIGMNFLNNKIGGGVRGGIRHVVDMGASISKNLNFSLCVNGCN